MCKRRCIYRGASGCCDYHLIEGRSRVAQVYETLGVKKMTDEAKKRLRPKKCPFFVEGRSKGKRKPIALPGSRPKEKQPRTAHNKGKYSFDSVAALRLYQQGCNDHQIADAVGTKPSNIAWWRKVNGLPANWKQGRTI